ncbi:MULTISPECIES: O-antigen ligase family protein [unclassified Sphingomonas]|uniref:O-antigen ligase family protein n=1 Tax=unclassified Sphingomonas TaxID=196159 RepID=UPI0009EC34BA|nr:MULTISPECIES: O-antigen ligase family protein [unclassified Sphingomonas]
MRRSRMVRARIPTHDRGDGANNVRRPGADVLTGAALIVALFLQLTALGANTEMLGLQAATANMIVALVALIWLKPPPGWWQPASAVIVPAIAAFAWAAIASVANQGVGGLSLGVRPALVGLVLLAGAMGAATTGLIVGGCSRSLDPLCRAFLVVGAAWMVLSLGLHLTEPGHVWGVDKGLQAGRFSATLLNPNAAGSVLAAIGILAAGRLIANIQHAAERYWIDPPLPALAFNGAALLLAALLTAMTQSRAAAAMLAVGVAILIVRKLGARTHRLRWPLMGTVAALVAIMFAALIVTGPSFAKIAMTGDDLRLRVEAIRHFGALTAGSPWFGYGYGAFDALNAAHLDPVTARLFWNFGAAHSSPISAAIQYGWPFVGLLTVSIATAATMVTRTWRHRPPGGAAVGMLLASGGIIACSLIDIALDVPAVAALAAAMAGLAIGQSMRHPAPRAPRHPVLVPSAPRG